MRNTMYGLVCAMLLGAVSTSWGAVGDILVTEDFEGYVDTPAMQGVWLGTVGTLDPAQGSDGVGGSVGQSAFHDGTVSVNEMLIPGGAVFPTTTEWLKLSVDIFDDDTSLVGLNPDNKRMSLGMRWFNDNPFNPIVENIIELGHWNAFDPGDDPLVDTIPHFAYRAILFNGPGAGPSVIGWDGWDMGTVLTDPLDPFSEVPGNSFLGAGGAGWHRYSVRIGPETLILDIDMDMDGTPDFSNTFEGLETTANGFDRIRFGGPSGITSQGGGSHFDNIVLEVIAPEPTTLSLIVIGGIFTLHRRSRPGKKRCRIPELRVRASI